VRLMVEGGPKVIHAMMQRGLVDRLAAFVAPVLVGDPAAPGISPGRTSTEMSSALRLSDVRVRRFGSDAMLEGNVRPLLDHEGAHGYASGQS
jgi:diaminohydroxyphosphoribosylaminopyrimidine deaminase/5-amino-6-(5-phosphoribosylamino)uracil reductase